MTRPPHPTAHQLTSEILDEIVVKHPHGTRPDTDLARDATTALTHSPGADNINAEVTNHWITLTGTTTWHYQRQAAVLAVEAIAGVTGVRTLVTLTPDQPFIAEKATAHITTTLQRNATTDARTITVTTEGTTIELTGHVSSWTEYRQTDDAAYSTPGVTHVHNLLHITP
ncbi:BON domain-containing protein [Rhodococcus antarcticus]|jgi:osmotically-inducible protein OsmY|uniref:BON domain-containing protein n=1 Tax=Rhodococcus antarcticus TaxID=2987751 RepID=A0ABY6P3E2_9NOCA|nr:BON domain-containing protein [Rhodococcus antarcticus]UZJ26014.1 BON domain-containing protein [Rhodococcus antarcticus]